MADKSEIKDFHYNPEELEKQAQYQQRQLAELSLLFGRETVELSSVLDVADLNLNEEMIASISNGVKVLKQLRDDPEAQQKLIDGMEAGERLLICLWILEMELLEKIQTDLNG